jgi:hypothetical protein
VTILTEIAVITTIAIGTFINKFAILTKRAIGTVGKRAGVFAVVGISTISGIETHVTILGNCSDIAIIAVFTGASPGAALRRLQE